MKPNITKVWKLNSPSMCRDFLKQVRIGKEGNQITYLQQADGKQVSIDEASDQQVLQVANELAEAIGYSK
jgi:hypothetical protein